MPAYHVSLARAADTEVVYALLAAAGEMLAGQGFANWTPPYSRVRLAADIALNVVWVVRDAEGALVATYALRAAPVRPNDPAPWTDPDAPARYLNRLAVDPLRHGRSIGRWCLDRIAAECARQGVRAIRCDVLAANERLCRFYESAGYVGRGRRGHSGWEFTCYEKVLDARG